MAALYIVSRVGMAREIVYLHIIETQSGPTAAWTTNANKAERFSRLEAQTIAARFRGAIATRAGRS